MRKDNNSYFSEHRVALTQYYYERALVRYEERAIIILEVFCTKDIPTKK